MTTNRSNNTHTNTYSVTDTGAICIYIYKA